MTLNFQKDTWCAHGWGKHGDVLLHFSRWRANELTPVSEKGGSTVTDTNAPIVPIGLKRDIFINVLTLTVLYHTFTLLQSLFLLVNASKRTDS